MGEKGKARGSGHLRSPKAPETTAKKHISLAKNHSARSESQFRGSSVCRAAPVGLFLPVDVVFLLNVHLKKTFSCLENSLVIWLGGGYCRGDAKDPGQLRGRNLKFSPGAEWRWGDRGVLIS